jgi:hypothetical protein
VNAEHPDRNVTSRQPWIGQHALECLPSINAACALGLEALALIKLYVPDTDWAAYIAGFDDLDIAFGLLTAPQIRVKTFHLPGLAMAHTEWSIAIRRARGFVPKTLRELQAEHEHRLDLRTERVGRLNIVMRLPTR